MNHITPAAEASLDKADKAIRPMVEAAAAAITQGMDSVREGSLRVQEKSLQARDATTAYIQQEPLKAVLMAAAAGAALMGVFALFTRRGSGH